MMRLVLTVVLLIVGAWVGVAVVPDIITGMVLDNVNAP